MSFQFYDDHVKEMRSFILSIWDGWFCNTLTYCFLVVKVIVKFLGKEFSITGLNWGEIGGKGELLPASHAGNRLTMFY
jgi:hypothetical protein